MTMPQHLPGGFWAGVPPLTTPPAAQGAGILGRGCIDAGHQSSFSSSDLTNLSRLALNLP